MGGARGCQRQILEVRRMNLLKVPDRRIVVTRLAVLVLLVAACNFPQTALQTPPSANAATPLGAAPTPTAYMPS